MPDNILSVLVTGGAGYIGLNLVELLSTMGIRVHIMDITQKTDILDQDIRTYGRVDYIVHLAAESSIETCVRSPGDVIRNNLVATQKVIEWSKLLGTPLIFASSQAIKNPDNLYGSSKAFNEVQITSQVEKSVCLRFANVYGGIKWFFQPGVVSKMVRGWMRYKKVIVNGNGTQKRDFIHVCDICTYILRCIDVWESGKCLPSIMELGTGKMTSIIELAHMFPQGTFIELDPMSNQVGVKENVASVDEANRILDHIAQDRLQEFITTACQSQNPE